MEIHIAESFSPTSVWTRSRISSAALFVNVTASTSSARASPLDDVRDAMGDDARLAGARSGEDEHRPAGLLDGFALFRVERGEEDSWGAPRGTR